MTWQAPVLASLARAVSSKSNTMVIASNILLNYSGKVDICTCKAAAAVTIAGVGACVNGAANFRSMTLFDEISFFGYYFFRNNNDSLTDCCLFFLSPR